MMGVVQPCEATPLAAMYSSAFPTRHSDHAGQLSTYKPLQAKPLQAAPWHARLHTPCQALAPPGNVDNHICQNLSRI